MMKFASLLALAAVSLTALGPNAHAQSGFTADVPILHEEAASAGIDQSYTGGWEFFVGGGAASFDCNGDRLPDLLIAGGSSPAKFYANESRTGGSFSFAPVDTGLKPEDLTHVLGAYPLDIDNDRHTDLVLLRLGRNLVLKGGPGCRFEKANRAFSIDGGRAWSTAMSAIWERGSRFPTMAIGNYVDRRAIVRCRCCSRTGTAPVGPI